MMNAPWPVAFTLHWETAFRATPPLSPSSFRSPPPPPSTFSTSCHEEYKYPGINKGRGSILYRILDFSLLLITCICICPTSCTWVLSLVLIWYYMQDSCHKHCRCAILTDILCLIIGSVDMRVGTSTTWLLSVTFLLKGEVTYLY